jgi:hypothetical protein
MADRISNYRSVRLVLQVPAKAGGRTYYSLHAISTVRGVPSSTILADGVVPPLAPDCTTEAIWEAINSAVAQNML